MEDENMEEVKEKEKKFLSAADISDLIGCSESYAYQVNGIEFMVNRVVDGINNMINALNRLSFDIPDWVPQLGGKSFGLSIPTIPTVSIPRLANGGITTGSTLANIGEAGREAVLPLENNTGWMDDLASKLASKMPDYSGAKTVMLAVDGKEFARINLPYLQDEEMRLGIVEG